MTDAMQRVVGAQPHPPGSDPGPQGTRAAAWVRDRSLRVEVARAAAAAGADLHEPPGAPDAAPSESDWARHEVVVLDAGAAAAAVRAGRSRREGVVIVVRADDGPGNGTPDAGGAGGAVGSGDAGGPGGAGSTAGGGTGDGSGVWRSAVRLGAEDVLEMPADAPVLLGKLSRAGHRGDTGGGGVLTVVGGHGGAGASVMASALALTAPLPSLLVDLDPEGPGADLMLGIEGREGLRWPDLRLQDGRVDPSALHRALPRRGQATVLSSAARGGSPSAGAVRSILRLGAHGGTTVVCDASHRRGEAVSAAVESADMTVLVVTADVPSCAAAVRTVAWLRERTPDAALVLRGPSPGGLRGADVESALGLPLLCAMRPEPGLPRRMEHAGVSFARRSPLAAAARAVHRVHARRPARSAA